MAREHKHINADEWGRVTFPDSIGTDGIDTCMGVGILNKKRKIAYLTHQYNFSDSNEMIELAIEEAKSPRDLEVVLCGNIPLSEEECSEAGVNFELWKEKYLAHGNRVYQKMVDVGIRNIGNWLANEPLDKSYRMCVDTETGKMTVEEE